MRAIITGSFDPMTLGHVEVVKKASGFFEEIYVVALLNPEKDYMFSMEEKKEIMRLSLSNVKNIIIDTYEGLTADYMHKHKITKIIRGIRNDEDRVYEEKLAKSMKEFDTSFDTIFIEADEQYSKISSTYAKKLIKEGKSLDGVIADAAKAYIIKAISLRK